MSDTNSDAAAQSNAGGRAQLPDGVWGAARIIAGYYGPVDLGEGVSAEPLSWVLSANPETAWRNTPEAYWLIYDEDREYGIAAFGQQNWSNAKDLVVAVHASIEDAEEEIDVLLEDGISEYVQLRREQAEAEQDEDEEDDEFGGRMFG